MENKKISFGFSKITKKPEIIKKAQPVENKVELIDCLEGQSIKIKDAVEVVVEPLIIPLKDTTKTIGDRIKEAKEKRAKQEVEKISEVLDSELTLDQLAARELIREAREGKEKISQPKVESVPVEDKFVAEGAEQSTLDDYENIPISEFGIAMLKGMGWQEGMNIGKTTNTRQSVTPSVPELRPKGLGLGAHKMIQKDRPQGKVTDQDGKEMVLCKNGFCKVIAGRYKGSYARIEAFDENCRAMIKTVGGETLNLNDFLLVPVTQKEYSMGSKIINNMKYEQYKDNEVKSSNKDESVKKERVRSRSRSRSRDDDRSRHKSHRDKSKSKHEKSKSRHRSHERRSRR